MMLKIYGAVLLLALSACKNGGTGAETDGADSSNTTLGHNQTEEADGQKSEKELQMSTYDPSPDRPYPYESGMIEYRYSGAFDGTQKVWFTNHGKDFRVEDSYVNMASPTREPRDIIYIRHNNRSFYISPSRKLGFEVKEKSGAVNLLQQINTMGIDSAMRQNKYTVKGSQNVDGKQCITYSSADSSAQFCFWNGINVKTDMAYGKGIRYTLTAEKIDENARVSSEMYALPEDVKIVSRQQFDNKNFTN